jgi:hypothetical protein
MRRILTALAFAIALASHSNAQTTFASITGLVTDPHGAVVVGATVTAINVASNYH